MDFTEPLALNIEKRIKNAEDQAYQRGLRDGREIGYEDGFDAGQIEAEGRAWYEGYECGRDDALKEGA